MTIVRTGEDLRGLEIVAAVRTDGRCPRSAKYTVVDAAGGAIKFPDEYSAGTIVTIIGMRDGARAFVHHSKIKRA